jgi:hypothetical protein
VEVQEACQTQKKDLRQMRSKQVSKRRVVTERQEMKSNGCDQRGPAAEEKKRVRNQKKLKAERKKNERTQSQNRCTFPVR